MTTDTRFLRSILHLEAQRCAACRPHLKSLFCSCMLSYEYFTKILDPSEKLRILKSSATQIRNFPEICLRLPIQIFAGTATGHRKSTLPFLSNTSLTLVKTFFSLTFFVCVTFYVCLSPNFFSPWSARIWWGGEVAFVFPVCDQADNYQGYLTIENISFFLHFFVKILTAQNNSHSILFSPPKIF